MGKITEVLAVIDAPYFCAGIVLHDDVVILAAPIVGYMKRQRWARDRVRSYCRSMRWTITVIYSKKIISKKRNADETRTS